MFKNILASLILLVLVGCGPSALMPIQHEAPVSTTSSQTVNIRLNSGAVKGYSTGTMIATGGIFVPVSHGPVPRLQFGPDDQQTFVDSLADELIRLNLASSVNNNAALANLTLTVNFVQTEHFPNFQEYKLTVSLSLERASVIKHKVYNILSSEGDSTWQKWNTNARTGKEKAAKQLMAAMIRDIETFTSMTY